MMNNLTYYSNRCLYVSSGFSSVENTRSHSETHHPIYPSRRSSGDGESCCAEDNNFPSSEKAPSAFTNVKFANSCLDFASCLNSAYASGFRPSFFDSSLFVINSFCRCIPLPSHWRSNKSLPSQFKIFFKDNFLQNGTKVSIRAGNEENFYSELKNMDSIVLENEARFDDLRFVGRSGRESYKSYKFRTKLKQSKYHRSADSIDNNDNINDDDAGNVYHGNKNFPLFNEEDDNHFGSIKKEFPPPYHFPLKSANNNNSLSDFEKSLLYSRLSGMNNLTSSCSSSITLPTNSVLPIFYPNFSGINNNTHMHSFTHNAHLSSPSFTSASKAEQKENRNSSITSNPNEKKEEQTTPKLSFLKAEESPNAAFAPYSGYKDHMFSSLPPYYASTALLSNILESNAFHAYAYYYQTLLNQFHTNPQFSLNAGTTGCGTNNYKNWLLTLNDAIKNMNPEVLKQVYALFTPSSIFPPHLAQAQSSFFAKTSTPTHSSFFPQTLKLTSSNYSTDSTPFSRVNCSEKNTPLKSASKNNSILREYLTKKVPLANMSKPCQSINGIPTSNFQVSSSSLPKKSKFINKNADFNNVFPYYSCNSASIQNCSRRFDDAHPSERFIRDNNEVIKDGTSPSSSIFRVGSSQSLDCREKTCDVSDTDYPHDDGEDSGTEGALNLTLSARTQAQSFHMKDNITSSFLSSHCISKMRTTHLSGERESNHPSFSYPFLINADAASSSIKRPYSC